MICSKKGYELFLSVSLSLCAGDPTDVSSIGKTVDNISNITDIGWYKYLIVKN